jgi:hypothetical protein
LNVRVWTKPPRRIETEVAYGLGHERGLDAAAAERQLMQNRDDQASPPIGARALQSWWHRVLQCFKVRDVSASR